MNPRRGRAISGAFVFLLLGVFAVFATVLVMLGTRAYRSTVDASRLHAEGRVLESFLVNAVRADDARNAVAVEEIDGMDVLHITADYDGAGFDKWIYCCDGSLKELFVASGFDFDPASGECICPAQEMQLELQDGLLTAVLTDAAGASHPAKIALRCAE